MSRASHSLRHACCTLALALPLAAIAAAQSPDSLPTRPSRNTSPSTPNCPANPPIPAFARALQRRHRPQIRRHEPRRPRAQDAPSSPWLPIRQQPLVALRPGQHHHPGRLPFHSPTRDQQLSSTRRVQDLPGRHALHRLAAHAFHPLQHRFDLRPRKRRRPRPQRGPRPGRLHQPRRGAQPQPGLHPYIARYEIHQVIGLTNRPPARSRAPLRWRPACPLRRIEFRIGKMTLPDFFDVNGPAPTATSSS
jgi:hypothetical protein